MGDRHFSLRWDLMLPAAALLVVVTSLSLADTAAGALKDRHQLAVEGRLSLLAHSLERILRETPPEQAREVLAAALKREAAVVAGLSLDGGVGGLVVGTPGAGPARRFELFLGPTWRGWLPEDGEESDFRGHGGGRRQLEVTVTPAALQPPPISRLLIPGALAAGGVLLGLSVLGGRLLVRHQEEERREGERRRLEGLARAGAGLAHQLRTPLATIKGSCQLLLERDPAVEPAATARRLGTILEQSERMDRLLTDLLDYARPPAPEPSDLELGPALAELADLDPRVQVSPASGLRVRVDPEHFRHVLTNLVSNALEHGPPESPVEIGARQEGKGAVEIRVADRGPGPGELPEHLFEPYVTSRAAGTGLGLPLARALANANGGTVSLEPRPGGGTVAVVRLPAAEGGKDG